jgi:hypothetical protein
MSGRLPQAAGLGPEANAGVAQSGAHPGCATLRDPGPLTPAFGPQSRSDTPHFSVADR